MSTMQELRVTVPVTNLRRKPFAAMPVLTRDHLQESQLLFNEALELVGEEGAWYHVHAKEQLRFSDAAGWHKYPGWVEKKDVFRVDVPENGNRFVAVPCAVIRGGRTRTAPTIFPVSFGTRLNVAGEAKSFFEIRMNAEQTGWVAKKDVMRPDAALTGAALGERVAKFARLFLGAPYLWGGRSMPLPWSRGPVTGVDCSGLVNLVFRVMGIDVPRNAQDQWVASSEINASDMRPGDLIFVSQQHQADSVYHVMMSLGGEQFIEAAQTGDIVHTTSFSQKFGLSLKQLHDEAFIVDNKQLYFRRIQKDKNC